MIKIIKRLIKQNQKKDCIYEEVEELIDHEDGNITEIRTQSYQGNPIDKEIFSQFLNLEQEKNRLLQSNAFDKSDGMMSFLRQYQGIRSIKRIKKLQKKLLGE
jgi:hypothetical protein